MQERRAGKVKKKKKITVTAFLMSWCSEIWIAFSVILTGMFYLISDRVEENLAAAEKLYASLGNNDPHYSGFLATRAEIALKNGDPVSAERDYREALKELEKYYGKSRAYAKTCHNLAAALDAQEKAEEAAGFRQQAEEIMAALKSTR